MDAYGVTVIFCLWASVSMIGLVWFAENKVRPYEQAGMARAAWMWVRRGIIFQVAWFLVCIILVL